MTARHRRQLVLLVLALACLAWTFTRPSAWLDGSRYRYVFVYDISQSMNVTDLGTAEAPLSRLQAAKRATALAAKALPCGSEIGLGVFTGHRPFLLVKPIEVCANYSELTAMVDQVDWQMTWRQRSEVAKGLFKSVRLLKQFETPAQLVFFTDGHEAPPIDPDLPPRFPEQAGDVLGLVVGTGGDALAPIPKFDEFGNPLGFFTAEDLADMRRHGRDLPDEHRSRLHETYLRGLAETTGLGFHRLGDGDDFVDALQRPDLGIAVPVDTDLRPVLALIALALTLVATTAALRRRPPASASH